MTYWKPLDARRTGPLDDDDRSTDVFDMNQQSHLDTNMSMWHLSSAQFYLLKLNGDEMCEQQNAIAIYNTSLFFFRYGGVLALDSDVALTLHGSYVYYHKYL